MQYYYTDTPHNWIPFCNTTTNGSINNSNNNNNNIPDIHDANVSPTNSHVSLIFQNLILDPISFSDYPYSNNYTTNSTPNDYYYTNNNNNNNIYFQNSSSSSNNTSSTCSSSSPDLYHTNQILQNSPLTNHTVPTSFIFNNNTPNKYPNNIYFNRNCLYHSHLYYHHHHFNNNNTPISNDFIIKKKKKKFPSINNSFITFHSTNENTNNANNNTISLPSPLSTSSSTSSFTNSLSSNDNIKLFKYKCIICQKLFKRPSSLKTHMNIHTGNKPFQCPNCKKTFNAKSNMLRHYKLHFRLSKDKYLLPNGEISIRKPTSKELLSYLKEYH